MDALGDYGSDSSSSNNSSDNDNNNREPLKEEEKTSIATTTTAPESLPLKRKTPPSPITSSLHLLPLQDSNQNTHSQESMIHWSGCDEALEQLHQQVQAIYPEENSADTDATARLQNHWKSQSQGYNSLADAIQHTQQHHWQNPLCLEMAQQDLHIASPLGVSHSVDSDDSVPLAPWESQLVHLEEQARIQASQQWQQSQQQHQQQQYDAWQRSGRKR